MASIDSFLGSSLQNLNTLDKKIANDGSDENMKKVVEYLYTLTEQLRYMFNNLDTENFTDGVFHRTIRDETTQQYTQIVQTNDALTAIVAGLNAAQKAAKLTFDAEGLSIQNGGFKILDDNNNTTMSVSNSGNVSIVGTYTTEEESAGGNLWTAILNGGHLYIKKGDANTGGFCYNSTESGISFTGTFFGVSDTLITSGTSYYAALGKDSNGGSITLKDSSKNNRGITIVGKSDSGNYGVIQVYNTSTGKALASIQGDSNGRGTIQVLNSSTEKIIATMYGNANGHGQVQIATSSGVTVGDLFTDSSGHGAIRLNNTSGNAMFNAGRTSGGYGYVQVYNSSRSQAYMTASSTGGQLTIQNSSGTIVNQTTVTSAGGYISLANSSGTTVLEHGVLSGAGGYINLKTSGGTNKIQMQVNSSSVGNIWADNYNNNSSRRYKKDITDMSDEQAQKLLDLKFVKFKYKDRDTYNYGLIAEDTDIEEIVTLDEKGRPDAIDYTKLIPYMGKLIQEQDKRIKALEMKQ